jgi:predicted nuclease with TOPRIM domain
MIEQQEAPQESVTERLDRLEQRMDELEERVKMLEQEVSLEQFCKGLELLGHRLMIQLNKTEDTKEGN